MASSKTNQLLASDPIVAEINKVIKEMYTNRNVPSQLKECFTRDLVELLKYRKTRFGTTLLDILNTAVNAAKSGEMEVFPLDPDCYVVFNELFDRIFAIKYGFLPEKSQPSTDFGEEKITELGNLNVQYNYVQSIRIRVCRSLVGYPFVPRLSKEQFAEIEAKVAEALENMDDCELKGSYHTVGTLDEETKKKLIQEHILFREDGRLLTALHGYSNYPTGRGIFLNKARTFIVWVCEEDHLRIISFQIGGDISAAYARLVKGLRILETKLAFVRNERLGFLNLCPSNLGSTIRASALVKIPKSLKCAAGQMTIAKQKLQKRGPSGEDSQVGEDGMCDVSNKYRLGVSEYESVKIMRDGVKALVELEGQLDAK